MELLRSFLTQDTGIHGLLFIGVYGDAEREGDLHHPLCSLTDLLAIPHKRVPLSNLCVEDIGLVISDVTGSDPDHCMELAGVVYKKTSGCALSVVQFLRTIEMKGLISYSITQARFEWQLDQIQSNIDMFMTESIRKKLSDQMQCLSAATKQLLKVAACFDFHFDPLVIVSIYEGLTRLDQNKAASFDDTSLVYQEVTRQPSSLALLSCLHNAVKDGILEIRRTDGRMKFSHSHCRSYFQSLVRDGTEADLLHWNIGQLLWRASKLPSKKEWMIVATVEQLNRGTSVLTLMKDKTSAARLTLDAARILHSTKLLFHAADHLQKGISLLDSAVGDTKKWSTHYQLTLNLHNLSAEVEYACGNIIKAKMMVDHVLLHGRSLHCKLSAYHVLMNLMGGKHNFDAAVNIGLWVIQAIGESVPVKMTTTGLGAVVGNLKRKLRRFTNDDLLCLPLTKNRKPIDAMKMLSSLVRVSWTMKRNDYFPSLALRMMEISMRDGLTPFSAEGFAIFGVVLATMGDVNEGHRYGALALEMGKKIYPGAHHCRASFVYYGCLHHLKSPAHESLGPLHAAYNTGFERGDATYALLAASFHSTMFYTCGLPITALLKDSNIHCNLAEQYGQSTTLRTVLWSRHVYASLAGQSSDVLEALENIGATECEEKDSETFAHSCWARLNVAFMFGNWSEAEELAGILRKRGSSFPMIQCFSECFLIGMTYATLARSTGKHSFNARYARNEQKRMEGWLERGCQSCHPYYMVLSAELGTLKSSVPKMRTFYQEAIRVARRTGMAQLEAIGNERLGVLLNDMGEQHDWEDHLKRAYELYYESGAIGKCLDLKSRYDSLFTSSTFSILSSSHNIPASFSRTTVKGKSMFTNCWSKSTRKKKQFLAGSGSNATLRSFDED